MKWLKIFLSVLLLILLSSVHLFSTEYLITEEQYQELMKESELQTVTINQLNEQLMTLKNVGEYWQKEAKTWLTVAEDWQKKAENYQKTANRLQVQLEISQTELKNSQEALKEVKKYSNKSANNESIKNIFIGATCFTVGALLGTSAYEIYKYIKTNREVSE